MLHTELPQRLAPRKTWKQYNGSCSLILKLRYRLAEEGCSQSQVSIARNLLSESVEDPASAEVAVNYLLRAAEQSDSEGLLLLEQCYSSGHGITDRNRDDVESCLGKSEDERAAHRVGRQIFDSVTLDGSVTLNETVFRQRLADGNCLAPDVDLKPRVGFGEITKSVQNCVAGCSPALSVTLEQPYLQRLRYLEDLISDCTTDLSNFGLWANLFLTALCSLLIYVLAYEPALITILQQEPLILFYVSFALAVACSAQFHCQKKMGEKFSAWTDLVSRFNDTVIKLAPQHRFRLLLRAKLLLTCSVSITSLCIFASQIQYVDLVTFSRSDLTAAVAVIFVCILYGSFTKSRVKISIVSSLFVLVLPDLYVGACGLFSVTSESFRHQYLHWPSTAFKVFLYCRIGYMDGYIAAISHFMCVTWLYICRHLMQSCAMEDFLLPACCVLLWTVTSKYVKRAHAAVLILVLKLFQFHSWVKLSFYCCVLYCVYWCVTACTVKLKGVLSWKKVALALLCAFVVMGVCDWYYGTEEADLDLDRYRDLCHGSDSNLEAVQACNPLIGTRTHFVGHVTSVEIVDTQNAVKSFTSTLPRSIQAAIACVVGKRGPACHKKFQSERDFATCQLYRDVGLPPCHLETWNIYRFEIGVRLETGYDVTLVTDSACRDFVSLLKEYDEIDITGRLISGAQVPKVELLRGTNSDAVCEARLHLSLDWMSSFATFVMLFQFIF